MMSALPAKESASAKGKATWGRRATAMVVRGVLAVRAWICTVILCTLVAGFLSPKLWAADAVPGAEEPSLGDAIAGVRAQIAAEREAFAAERRAIDAERATARQDAGTARADREGVERELQVTARRHAEAEATTRLSQQALSQNEAELARLQVEIDTFAAGLAPVAARLTALDAGTESLTPPPTPTPSIAADSDPLSKAVKQLSEQVLAGSTLYRGSHSFFLPDGRAADGSILRIGLQGGVFRTKTGSDTPFALRDDETRPVLGTLPASERALPEEVFDDSRSVMEPFLLPFDLTAGEALLNPPVAPAGWLETFRAGGAVAWPLAAMAILALLMIAERAVFYTRVRLGAGGLSEALPPLLRSRDYAGASAALATGAGPLQRVWQRGTELLRTGGPNLEESLQEAILAEVPVLERFLSTLAVFAALAPLLGLLGTVSGMIKTFQTITVYGTGDARLLSGGISEALVSTEMGLAVAIPLLLAHAILSRQARLLTARLDQAALLLLETAGSQAHPATDADAGPAGLAAGDRSAEVR